MGARFSLEHANIIAYLTSPWVRNAPAVPLGQLRDFLFSLQDRVPIVPREYEYEYRRSHDRIISSREDWKNLIQDRARYSLQELDSSLGRRATHDSLLDKDIVERLLDPLAEEFKRFELYALFVGKVSGRPEFESFWRYASYASEGWGLYLFPDDWSLSFKALEPFPVVKLISEQLDKWPGVAFWTRRGQAAFVQMEEAEVANAQLIQTIRYGGNPDEVLSQYRLSSSRKLLHLSDLHFGRPEASENWGLLYTELHNVIPSVDRVVITGDLFDNPERIARSEFNNFLTVLDHYNKESVIIPGNHDSRWLGNDFQGLGKSHEQLVKLQWSNVEVDEDIKCVFFCFDSSRGGDFARGKITTEQMRDVALNFRTKRNRNQKIDKYKRIALIHHHPYPFETAPVSFIQRFLNFWGKSDEQFLNLEDADEFLDWCVKMNIPLILHGHKHKQRYVAERRYVKDDTHNVSLELTSVGCGTSLGAENYPLTYNLIAWDPSSERWSVSFYAGKADGSGFVQQAVSVSSSES